ncbi:MAG: branched-chain-amino-acid transaminase [Thaumarchaeota archaeon]|nr:branched-chain-amino-acid transaminase [Candidatus Terraquivivens yellowstonensis]MCL7387128.1 branched-chain-amino-acid transaminase [Candidatus Terraquivivens yellowstonensis]MCL7392400.1 branched-chain-amino-acid transaminase [Candidatus Terraquivivens yellowstonensis]MCL7394897.1 branched-chain-amino-acid transaminase [Candidatus Terraquivivens yellowstonensis]MCL7397868.1 branched-chain-amino-acid transaminase [Candidatus Terraquivivens yellowstonensis]
MSEPLVYIDGKFYPKSEAKISVFDHGLLYGDGVFEGIRVYDGVIFLLKEHIDRLYNSAKFIKLNIPISKEEMIAAVVETVKRNRAKNSYIRLVVTRGMGDLGLDPRKCSKPSIIIIVEQIQLVGGAAKEKGVSAIIASTRRDSVSATTHEVKSLNYLNSILAKLEAIEAGADMAIMLDSRGFVSEAEAANLFIVRDGIIATPPTTAGILDGVTRRRIIRLIRELGMEIVERDITPFELITATEVFLTGTGAEILPVVKINGIQIGDGVPGPITKKIMQEFEKIVRSGKEGVKVQFE